MRSRNHFLLTLVSLLALTMFASSSVAQGPQPRKAMLITTDGLAKIATQPSTVIVQIARDPGAFSQGHIPGARLVLLSQLAVQKDGVDNELAPVTQLVDAFESAGISNSSRIYLYDDAQGMLAARAYFTLDYLGLGARAALLDGGLGKWRAEGRPVETAALKVLRGKIKPAIRPELVVSYNELRDLSAKSQPGMIIDARSPQHFSGPGAAHVPGASNVFWTDTMDPARQGAFKQPDTVKAMYANAGVKPGTKPVVYCNSGMQASHTYFTLKWMGYEPRLYDGSMQDWTRHSGDIKK